MEVKIKLIQFRVLLTQIMQDVQIQESLSQDVFTVYGTAVSWKACLQSVVALSTTEAEYIALTKAVREALWLRGLITDLRLKQGSLTVFCESQSAIHLTRHQVLHE
ncbi:hypothetical protein PanWU01x14_308500 [Parasponia andersonii]|uniref:Uncharacterized protein n=1 Tax=Parasponia andersonii TaxID=3476 RepID=A0A2P5AQW8_PARAD|nr:hypothetical protein PanWU01x14_308500 [Parasponia andersonii]